MPFLLITLQSSHIFLTEARTFIESSYYLIFAAFRQTILLANTFIYILLYR